jgi:DNA-binding NarL/FixJ family response regulator
MRLRPAIPSSASNGTSAGNARGGRILVVEDDYFVALELEHRLLDAGFDVVGIATTAEEALDKARSGNPDLAVMDIRLAGSRDGIDAATDLIELGIPSIFATAHADPGTKQRAEQARPLGWLQKPYSSESLVALIQQALAGRS